MTSRCVYCTHQSNVKDRILPTECTLSDGKPSLACERQVKLLSRIEETKTLLDKLITEEREARAEINRYHDPLHRLPTEIITHIFRLTLPAFLLQKGLAYPGCPDPKLSELGALTLGAVCRTWRRVAWSTPQLWSNVMLALHHEPSWNQISVVEEWLERSKPLPLKIQLFLTDPEEDVNDSDREEPLRNTFPQFIKSFIKHSSRWRILSVEAPNWFSRYFSGPSQDGAPLLATLQLLHPRGFARFALEGVKLQPTIIEVAGYHRLKNLGVSFSNTTSVSMVRFLLNDYVELLRNAPQLIRLHLHHITFPKSFSHLITATPLVHNQLQELLVSPAYEYTPDKAAVFYSVIFDSITAPHLVSLNIDGPETSFLHVKQFLTRSSAPLTFFALTVKCIQQDVVDLLYHLPPSLPEIDLDLRNPSGVSTIYSITFLVPRA